MSDLLTRKTARRFQIRHMAEYKTTERIILLAQAEALEWAVDRWVEKKSGEPYLRPMLEEAARLRKEAE